MPRTALLDSVARAAQLALLGASLGALAGLGDALVEVRLQDYVGLGYLRSAALECGRAAARAGAWGGALGLGAASLLGLARSALGRGLAPGRGLAALHSEVGRRWLARLAGPLLLGAVAGVALREGAVQIVHVVWLAGLAVVAVAVHRALRPLALRAPDDPRARATALAVYGAVAILLAGVWMLDAARAWSATVAAQHLILFGVAGAAFVSLRMLLARPARWAAVAHPILAPALLPPLLLLVVAPALAPSVQAANPRNVVLIGIDTLRADRTSLYGDAPEGRRLTPSLEALAAHGTRFSRAISQAPWTMPSFATVLTGRYPAEHGANSLTGRLSRGALTLAEILREAGWRTGAVVSHDLVATRRGFGQGFDAFDESQVGEWRTTTSAQITDRAAAWLRRHRGERFFLFVHYFDAHYPYLDHADLDFTDGYTGWLRRDSVQINNLLAKRHLMGPDELAWLTALYDEEIVFTDREIGRLLAVLGELGLEDETAVVVTADHGEEFLERGWFGHTVNLNQECVRVPLVTVLPGIDAEPEVTATVETRAIFPTLLDYLGIGDAARPGSLLPAIRRGGADGGAAFSAAWLEGASCAGTGQCMRLSAVERSGWKLVLDRTRERVFLYDVRRDPLEREDRSAAEPAQVAELRAELDAWEARVSGGAAPESAGDVPEEERARLRALGYL